MNERVAKRLHDALIAAQRIDRYVAGRSFDQYHADDYFRSAVERQFEVLSEALNVTSGAEPAVLGVIPEISRIVGMRNRIAHSYDVLDDALIWEAATVHIPTLIPRLTSLLDEFGVG